MIQIFLPYPDLNINAKILDEHTLNKQCAATTAILHAIMAVPNGNKWEWNPAVTMWKGNEAFLGHYGHRLFGEWKAMGYPDHWSASVTKMGFIKQHAVPTAPWWWGHDEFHQYNKAVLLNQNPKWYGQFFKGLPTDLIGWWPNAHEGQWIRGPKTKEGIFIIKEHPVFESVSKMSHEEFADHANLYHRLTPDMKGGIKGTENPHVLQLLRTLHDRYHVQRVYTSHDHR